MDSINTNQPEDNHEDLGAGAAVDKIKQIVNKSKACFFCTSVSAGSHTRPMSVQQVDNEGNLWFLSSDDSHKNLELTEDPTVKLYFQGFEHSDFLQIDGIGTISRDKEKIKELWQFIVGNWFTKGIEDPRITVIKVRPTDGYYWDTKHSNTVAGIKMFFGALTKTTLDDSVEGRLKV